MPECDLDTAFLYRSANRGPCFCQRWRSHVETCTNEQSSHALSVRLEISSDVSHFLFTDYFEMRAALQLQRHGRSRWTSPLQGVPFRVQLSRTANTVHFQSMFKSTTTSTMKPVMEEQEDRSTENKKREPYITDFGLPSLIPEWRKMFRTESLFTDVSAGLTVGCVAVPLSLAIAVASGVPAEVGLVTAAVSGIAGGLMGGTTLAITGPAAAISLLVVSAVEQHGIEALPLITMACGGLQLASGVTRLGVAAKLVPISVIAGFTTGVGSLILTGQIPKALGISAPTGLSPLEVLSFLGENIGSINPSAAALAIGTSAAMFALPKVHPKMPSALLAVGGATLATHAFGLDVQLIGTLPSGLEAFQFGIPMMPSMDSLPSLAATTFLIYAMTSAESLLSCAALEKMKKTDYKHNPDQELIGQGLANMGSAFFMGMPVTSVIARSGLNVRLNAESRLPALVQSAFVFSSVVFLSDKIAMIPMPALSGMLITTGLGMLNPTEFKHCYAVQKKDVIPFLATIGGMVSFGLAEGIGIGCASALALNYNGWATGKVKMQFEEISEVPMPHLNPTAGLGLGGGNALAHHLGHWNKVVNKHLRDRTMHTESYVHTTDRYHNGTVWQIDGPINFLSMFEIDDMMRRIKEQRKTESSRVPLVLDMNGVTSLEFTGIEELVNRLLETADGATIKMMNCNKDVLNAMDQCDPRQQIIRFSTSNDLSSNQ